jgi:hypothetical protein
MTAQVRQNTYGAWLDGDVTAMEALRSLCADYEEIESSYKDFESLRNTVRDQMSNVLEKLDGKAEIKGFGKLTLSAPSVTEGYDKAQIRAIILDLIADYPDIAGRLAACATKSMRAGGLLIEREKTAR